MQHGPAVTDLTTLQGFSTMICSARLSRGLRSALHAGLRRSNASAASDSQQDLPAGVVQADHTGSASTTTAPKARKGRVGLMRNSAAILKHACDIEEFCCQLNHGSYCSTDNIVSHSVMPAKGLINSRAAVLTPCNTPPQTSVCQA